MLGFPEDYKVDGFISYGSWSSEKEFSNFKKNIESLKIKCETKLLPGFCSDILEVKNEDKIYWFATIYGSTKLSEYLHVACLFGSNKNIHIGSCGGLNPEANSSDLIIPTWSYGDESSTRMYDRSNKDHKFYSDVHLNKLIESKISTGNKIWNGPIMTCQSMLAETLEDVQSWSKEGYYGVEMETATFFSISNHFNVPCSALIYISDNLIKGQTVGDEEHQKEKDKRGNIKDEVYKAGILSMVKI